MTTNLSPLAEAYVRTTNSQDAAGFLALFADNAVVNDAGREHRGLDAIKEWCKREIFAVQVRLEVMEAASNGREEVVLTKVDGNFDRTGLPDPLYIRQTLRTDGVKVVGLTCELAQAP